MSARPETGPMQFGDDWTGVFLRGDYAGPVAFMIGMLIDHGVKTGAFSPIELAPVRSLARTLAGSDERGEREGLQRMKAFEECVEQYEAKDVG